MLVPHLLYLAAPTPVTALLPASALALLLCCRSRCRDVLPLHSSTRIRILRRMQARPGIRGVNSTLDRTVRL
jgi:hypothetical protein